VGFIVRLIISSNSWKDFEQALAPLDNNEEGRVFEELTRLHLLTNPTFSTKIKKIWHHSDVPQKIVDELGLQRPEIGVDLVAQVKDDTYWAIQCKYHQDRNRNITYNELSTFFSITERDKTYPKLSHRLVCTSANGVSHRVDKAHPEKLGYLTSLEFSKLGKEQFDAFRELLAGGHPAPKPYAPRTHQKIAVEKVKEHFKGTKTTRGKIIHPCGSGKSLTGYWISQALKSKTVLIAVPSLALVRQTLGSWTREAVANNIEMDWIAVCSDDDVKNSDDPSMHKADLGIEVDTDPDVVASFLLKRSKGTKVLITTYQSGHAVSEGVKKAGFVFDLGVYDEAHKTVGQKDKAFAHLLYDENMKVKKRVFMTATERQFRGNSDEYLSMDDEEIYGPVIHELSFKAALEQKPPILSDYKIVSTIVTKSEIDKLIKSNDFVKSDGKDWSVEGDASTFASLIALRKLVKERDIKHVVSFHSSIKRSKDFMELNAKAMKADNSFGNLSLFHVSGKDSMGVRVAELERFVDAEPSLITNARCLTEGVDVPAIDAVLFADPKQSKIDIVQAAGRALRKFDGKEFGYIIVPVVLDEEAENLSDDAFKQIITVISALGVHDERIIEEFKEIANGKRKDRECIVNIDVPEIVRVKFEDFISNVEIQIWDRLNFGWAKGFRYLEKYILEHGNCNVPQRHESDDGFKLGDWIGTRRRDYRNNLISAECIRELELIPGWIWNPLASAYQEGLDALKQFELEKGYCTVPSAHVTSSGFKLGIWCSHRRKDFKNRKLSRERIRELEGFKGWVWNALDASFVEAIIHLEQYLRDNGHSKISQSFCTNNGFKLGAWVSSIRMRYKEGRVKPDRVKKVGSLPLWVWRPEEANFQQAIYILKEYISSNGNSRVFKTFISSDGFKLGSWVFRRRGEYRKGKLAQNHIEQLEAINEWVWDPLEHEYEKAFSQLKQYVDSNGHSLVPQSFVTDTMFRLGNWVGNRRQEYKTGKLPPARVEQLSALPGWVWDVRNS
jgi:superfamily II DNA or RNA helicase